MFDDARWGSASGSERLVVLYSGSIYREAFFSPVLVLGGPAAGGRRRTMLLGCLSCCRIQKLACHFSPRPASSCRLARPLTSSPHFPVSSSIFSVLVPSLSSFRLYSLCLSCCLRPPTPGPRSEAETNVSVPFPPAGEVRFSQLCGSLSQQRVSTSGRAPSAASLPLASLVPGMGPQPWRREEG